MSSGGRRHARVSAKDVANSIGRDRVKNVDSTRRNILDNEFLNMEQRKELFGELSDFMNSGNTSDYQNFTKGIKNKINAIGEDRKKSLKVLEEQTKIMRESVNSRLTSRENIAATFFGAVSQKPNTNNFTSAFAEPVNMVSSQQPGKRTR